MNDPWDFLDKLSIVVGLLTAIIGILSTLAIYILNQNKKIKQLEESLRSNQINLINGKLHACFDDIFSNVNEVKVKIINILKDLNEHEEISILNLGLDLDTIVSMIKYDFTTKNEIAYKCLVINPLDPLISLNCKRNISSKYAAENIKKLKDWFELHGKKKNIKIEIVSYNSLPVIHGFLLNNTHLFLGFTVFEEAGLAGGNYSYIYINKSKKNNLKLREDLFKTYATWFTYLFENGKPEYSSLS